MEMGVWVCVRARLCVQQQQLAAVKASMVQLFGMHQCNLAPTDCAPDRQNAPTQRTFLFSSLFSHARTDFFLLRCAE